MHATGAMVRDTVIEPSLGAPQLGTATLDQLLARAADVTLLIDFVTGAPVCRWYDPDASRLHLPSRPAERVIDWVHPDDIPSLIDVLASVARDGGSRNTVARIRPEDDGEVERSLLISIHDVTDFHENGLLVQAWLIDFDHTRTDDLDSTAFSSLAEAAPIGLQVRSANTNVTFENERFTALAASARDLIDEHVLAGMQGAGELIEDLEVDGRSLRIHVVPTVDDQGRLVLAVASLEDVTSLRVAEAGRAAAEGLFRAVFDGSPAATAIVELDGRFAQVNEALAMILGYSVDELIGMNFADITHPDDLLVDLELLAEVLAGKRSGYQMEKRYVHRAGHEVWAELTVATVRDATGAISHFVSTVEDITARKSVLGAADSNGDLAYWAIHDHLTGLPNRRHLDNYLASTFGPRRRASDRLVVLFLDLDDFKPVNDEHGHQIGDEVLRTIARRLRNTSREDELVARYGGDEFVVVTRKLRTAHDVSLLVERILERGPHPDRGSDARARGGRRQRRHRCGGRRRRPRRGAQSGRRRLLPGQARGQEPGPLRGLRRRRSRHLSRRV